jgi:hypothetical protein
MNVVQPSTGVLGVESGRRRKRTYQCNMTSKALGSGFGNASYSRKQKNSVPAPGGQLLEQRDVESGEA